MAISFSFADKMKPKPESESIGFGTHETDHIFITEYVEGIGWHKSRIEPYSGLTLDPRALAFHYGCSIFEGLKIYPQLDGTLAVFRPDKNAARLNQSAELVALPNLPPEIFLEGLCELVKADASWISDDPNIGLYARPVMLGSEAVLGVQRPKRCLFFILLTPTATYYKQGQPGFRLYADRSLSRGGNYSVASSKTAGNYGKMVVPTEQVRAKGYDNILWLGGPEHVNIEEAGITNVFVVYNDKIVTPPLNGRILPGVTRDSIISLIAADGSDVHEEETDIRQLCDQIKSGQVQEVFLTGTATTVAPVQSIHFEGVDYQLKGKTVFASSLFQRLSDIQHGRIPDTNGWLLNVG